MFGSLVRSSVLFLVDAGLSWDSPADSESL